MPIEPFSLEDLTGTLQVPIPGIPGAYGEIEVSAEGTATVALGAEVPVPLLGDVANAEFQVEIDKEGEIAFGIEVNLVGLQVEVMIRGCDIVVGVDYGGLGTEATFPIPDCGGSGNDEEPPPRLTTRPAIPPNVDYPIEIRYPPNFSGPILDPDKKYFFCAWISYDYDGKPFSLSGGLELTSWNPPGTIIFDNHRGYRRGRNIKFFRAAYYTPNWGWFQEITYTSIGQHPSIGSFEWISDSGISGWLPITMPGGRVIYHRDTGTTSVGAFGAGFWFFVGTGAGFQALSATGILDSLVWSYPVGQGPVKPPAWFIHTQELSIKAVEIPPSGGGSRQPPLRGVPPMENCCAEIKAQLRRLRKELKEVRDVFDPKGFTEAILPPKYDEKGEKIKPGNDAVTLPEVLKEIGESGSSGTYDPQIAEIAAPNIPVSWQENEPPIKQELPKEKVSDEWVYREMFTLLHEIRYALDPLDIQQSEIPSRFIHPGVREGYEVIRSYPELFKNLFLMLDKVGFQPFQVQIDDTNPAVEGNQSETQQYHSMGAAFESTIKYLIDIEGDQDAHTSFLVRLAYEVILLHQISAATQQTVSNIQDFLGYELRKKKESIPMAFNPLADNPANRGKLDENTEESVERLLPNLLKNGTAETTVEEYVGRKDLIDFLFEILNAARQKPKGNRLG